MSEASEASIIAPVPRVTIQAFCETEAVSQALQAAGHDRRMQRARTSVSMGGPAAALAAFAAEPTPNLIVIESSQERTALLADLDRLSEFCDAGTKVLVIGHVNDVLLYRELTRRGVSDYLIAPVATLDVVQAISDVFQNPGADPIGRTIAVVGAKGGVGASTIAHNLAWAIARKLATATTIVDLDIAFGTAGLDFNQDPPQGVAEAVFAPDRIDANLVDRLLSKCGDNLNLLAASAMLDRTVDLTETALDQLLDILRSTTPTIVLDMPHTWTSWARRTLVSADDLVIVGAPELASLRNTKNMVDVLRNARPNDRPPRVVLNLTGMPKRPEIPSAEFAKAIGVDLAATVPFDAQLFGTAANNGQMIAEVQPGGKVNELFVDLAAAIMGRPDAKRGRTSFLQPLMAKFTRRKAV
ncbi:MAG TPA: AAA family ATPase [Microvirga sp.]|jgi:pilus assembly protein CpaE|nr:AAA family ATPase [Microvirga sp.]